MAEVLTQTAPATPAVQAETPKPEVKESLITRASKVSLESANPEKSDSTPSEAIKLDQATIDRIADPVLKQAVIEAHKSMQADYTRKTQDLAAKRKETESLKSQLEQSGKYTPSKIQELLNDPSFVQAAQDYQKQIGPVQNAPNTNGVLTEEEFSYLPPEQQKAYRQSQEATFAANSALRELNLWKQQAAWEREDSELKSKYANYDPSSVTQIFSDMMNGKVNATREHLWKVRDYDDAVNRAYQLGLQDRKLEQGEKFNASSQPNNISVTPSSGDVPTKLPNESQPDHWRRIAQNAMKKVGVIK